MSAIRWDGEAESTQDEVMGILDCIRPRAMAAHRKMRCGDARDGGYVVPDLPYDAAASIGIGESGADRCSVSFDIALAQRGIPVWQFDHTIKEQPATHERFHFHRKGWGARSAGDLLSLADIRRMLPGGATLPLLKFDAEGIEWAALDSAETADIEAWAAITGEFHGLARLADPVFRYVCGRVFRAMLRTHAPIHLHANNVGLLAFVAGIVIPDLLEVTWVRRDIDPCPDRDTGPMPGMLDAPNDPGKPDIVLRAW